MPNTQVTGFMPAKTTSSTGTIVYQRRMVGTNNGTAIFKFDAVVPASTGLWVVASSVNTAVGGVAVGASYVDSNGVRVGKDYLPAATTYSGTAVDNPNASYIFVAKGEDAVFRASVDEAIVSTGLGVNYVMVLGAGSTTTGRSGHELDATGATTTATFPWRVEEFVLGDPLVDPTAADAHVFCRINRGLADPSLSDGTGT